MAKRAYFDSLEQRDVVLESTEEVLAFLPSVARAKPPQREAELERLSLPAWSESRPVGPFARLQVAADDVAALLDREAGAAAVRLEVDDGGSLRAFRQGEILVELSTSLEQSPDELFSELGGQAIRKHRQPRTFTVSTRPDEDPIAAIQRFRDARPEAFAGLQPSEVDVPDPERSLVDLDLQRLGVLQQLGLPPEVAVGGSNGLLPPLLALEQDHYVPSGLDRDVLPLPHFCMGVHEVWNRVWGQNGSAWAPGEGSVIVMVDEPVFRQHPDLEANILPFPPPAALPSAGLAPAVGNSLVLDAGQNHGTRMSGVAAALRNGLGTLGVAPAAKIISAGVDLTVGDPFPRVADGIDLLDRVLGFLIRRNHRQVVFNFSWSRTVRLRMLERFVRKVRRRGYLMFAAADNNDRSLDEVQRFPACLPEVTCIGALELQAGPSGLTCGRRFTDSNFGSHVLLSAPGELYLTSNLEDRYFTVGETSPACAASSGVAALLWSIFPQASGQQILDAMKAGSQTIHDTQMGLGWIHAGRSFERLSQLFEIP